MVKEFGESTWQVRLVYRVFRTPLFLFGIAPIYYFLVGNRITAVKIGEVTETIKKERLCNNLLIASVYAILTWILGWKFLIIQGITVYLFSIIAFWFFYVQHSHEEGYHEWSDDWDYIDAGLHSSRYDLHPIFHWLTGNIGYHHLHHLNPVIASYMLAEADKETFPLLKDTIKNLSFWESLACVWNKLWDEDEKKFISFAEFERRYK
jgi:acyl-lipid omega-6 desaturase (Delta-12 desaturase)